MSDDIVLDLANQFGTLQQALGRAQVATQQLAMQMAGIGTAAAPSLAAMDKLANSLSGAKLIQDAQNIAGAVDKIGGVSKLTDAELQRVGATAAEAVEKMKRMGTDVPPGIQKIADAAKGAQPPVSGLSGTFGELGTSVLKTAAGFVTAQAIIGAVTTAWHAVTGEIASSIKAASDAEHAHVQLVAALRSQGTAVPSVIAAYQQYATALQNTTIYQDDAIEGAAAMLVQIGNVMPRDMEAALKATTNLASGLGIDLDTAVRMVAKSAEGNVTALKKAGVQVDETKLKQEGFGAVLDAITAKFGGQAEAIAGTYDGRLKQLGNTWNNVEESIGRVITQNATVLGAFDQVNKAIAGNTTELGQNRQATNLVSEAVILAVRSFGALAPFLQTAALAAGGVTTAFFAVYAEAISMAAAVDAGAIKVLRALQTMSFGHMDLSKQIKFLEDDFNDLRQRYQANIQAGGAVWDSTKLIADGMGKAGKVADQLAIGLEGTRGKTLELKDATDGGTDAWTRHTTAVQKGAEATQQATKLLDAGALSFKTYVQAAFPLVSLMPDLSARSGAFREGLDNLSASGIELNRVETAMGAIIGGTLIPAFATLPNVVAQSTQAIKDATTATTSLASTIGDNLAKTLDKLPSVMEHAFEGGGGLLGAAKSIGVQLAADIVGPLEARLSKAAQTSIAAGGSVAAGVGGEFGGNAGAIIGATAASIGGAAVGAAMGAATVATVGGAVALGAATAGIGLAAVGAYIALKHLFSLDPDYVAAKENQQKIVDALKTTATQAEIAEGAMSDTYHTIAIVGRDAFLAVGQSADVADQHVQDLLNTSNPAAFARGAQALDAALKQAAVTATSVQGIVDAGKAIGGTLPPALRASIDQLASMKGITDDERASLLALTTVPPPNFDQLTQTAANYGITLAGLGPKFQQANIDGTAKGIFDDFTALATAGADVGGVLQGMGKKIGDLVHDSIAFGTAIPDNMRPLIQNLIDTGQLTDSAGDKFTDITKIAFEDTPVDQGLTSLQDKVTNLISTLSGDGGATQAIDGVANALANIPDKDITVRVHVVTDGTIPGDPGNGLGLAAGGIVPAQLFATGGVVDRMGAQYLARAGVVLPFLPRGTDTVPAMLTPGEGVLSTSDMAALGGPSGFSALRRNLHGAGGAAPVIDLAPIRDLHNEVKKLRRDMADRDAMQPTVLTSALSTALRRRGA